LTLPILYQDDDLVATSKPSGLPVHRDAFSPRGQVVCLQTLRDQLGREVHPVHRLDSATSGVMLFALSRDVLGTLSKQFMERDVRKVYHAVVRGWIEDDVQCDEPLRDEGRSLAARTRFKVLKRIALPWPNTRHAESRYSYVEVRPTTGRFHQIRRHANHLGHPIVGDTKHGNGEHNRLWRSNRGCFRLLLHATSLEVTHPIHRTPMTLVAPPPDEFARQLDELPWTPAH
jgi:tRNA pseudouridine65 synthase